MGEGLLRDKSAIVMGEGLLRDK